MKKLLCLLLALALMLCGCLPVGNLSTLSGDDLVVALAFPADDVSSMSPERQVAYTAACLELEVMNELGSEETTLKTFPYADLAMSTSIRMENLVVKDVYTTDNEDSSSKGAMTLTCQAGDVTITVRTAVLLDENNQRITADAYLGKTIDVKGIVDLFDGDYQVKVFSANNITVK